MNVLLHIVGITCYFSLYLVAGAFIIKTLHMKFNWLSMLFESRDNLEQGLLFVITVVWPLVIIFTLLGKGIALLGRKLYDKC
jgi:hypothetical protein